MRLSRLSEFCAAGPFVPFEVFLVDGRAISVKHPDYISLDPAGDTATVYYEQSNLVEVIDLAAIISLQYRQEK